MYANLASRALSSAARYGSRRWRSNRIHNTRVRQARRVNRSFPSSSTYTPSTVVTRQTRQYDFADLLSTNTVVYSLDTPWYGTTRMREYWDRYRVQSVTYSFQTLTEGNSADLILYRIVDRDGSSSQYTLASQVTDSALATVDHVGTGNYNGTIKNITMAAGQYETRYCDGRRSLSYYASDSLRFAPVLYMSAKGSALPSLNTGTLVLTTTIRWQFIGCKGTDTATNPTVKSAAPPADVTAPPTDLMLVNNVLPA